MIACWIRPLTTSISSAGTRLFPSAVGIRRWQMIPFSEPARLTRIWVCWWGGKKSTIRLIVSVALMVCRVENTRWPVSAAVRAAETVSCPASHRPG